MQVSEARADMAGDYQTRQQGATSLKACRSR
jgi:hypothetical protein